MYNFHLVKLEILVEIKSVHAILYKLLDICSPCRIIGQLETLKKEAAEVQRKVDETDIVMGEVERVSQQYMPLSSACSSIYFTLESLHQVS